MKTVHKKTRVKPPRTGDGPATLLPSRDAVKAFLAEARGKVGMREIARAFGVGPDDKKALRG